MNLEERRLRESEDASVSVGVCVVVVVVVVVTWHRHLGTLFGSVFYDPVTQQFSPGTSDRAHAHPCTTDTQEIALMPQKENKQAGHYSHKRREHSPLQP